MADRPIILAVDDEPGVVRAVERDLRRRYSGRYRIVRAESGEEALSTLEKAALRGDRVALIVADQRMPRLNGVETLERAIGVVPDAKRVLLTAYADTQAAIDAINRVRLDHYLLKPWDPPEESLYPVLDDLLGDWEASTPRLDEAIRVVGHRFSRASHEARDFLARNGVPYRWLDIERDPEAGRLVTAAGSQARLPLVLLPGGEPLEAPTTAELATAAGIGHRAELPFYDLVIVGGGPAGLAAAVYGASEGLVTALVEEEAPGGQAGQSSRIENYLGFPVGLSGADLARRATAQAQRFGAELLTAQSVAAIEARGSSRVARLTDGSELGAHAVILATGVQYRRLDAPGVEELTGRGIYYGASRSEAVSCAGDHVIVVGGANSAGQAALFFAERGADVTILCRGDDLGKSMSSYLVERVEVAPNITVRVNTAIVAAQGDRGLDAVIVRNSLREDEETLPAAAMFVFIGARPQTGWLGDAVARDASGFVLTGPDVKAIDRPRWSLERDPLPLETSLPGVFAAGDVRNQSMKRVASAVGEGAMAVALVHQYVSTL